MRSLKQFIHLFVVLSIIGCRTVQYYEVAASTAMARRYVGPMRWEVNHRFRLLKEDRGQELIDRVKEYHQTVLTQSDDEPFATYWNPAKEAYDPSYLQPVKTWNVTIYSGIDAEECDWRINGVNRAEWWCQDITADVPSKNTVVEVRAVGDTAWRRVVVEPHDVFIATLGDSYASGEGVPELRGAPARWTDSRCNRSIYAGHTLAALFYSELDPHVSVTYVSFACSGATMGNVVSEPYAKMDENSGILPPNPIQPQIDALKLASQAMGKSPDLLTLSLGGNDVGFSGVIEEAVTSCSENGFRNAVKPLVVNGIAGMNAKYLPVLLQRMKEIDPNGQTLIYVTAYPDPTIAPAAALSAAPGVCGSRLSSEIGFLPAPLSWFLRISDDEVRTMRSDVATPLSKFEFSLAGSLGAMFIEDVQADFAEHGFCAPGLNDDVQAQRWLNSYRDSSTLQDNKYGAMHPNIRGQTAIATRLVEAFLKKQCAPAGWSRSPACHRGTLVQQLGWANDRLTK